MTRRLIALSTVCAALALTLAGAVVPSAATADEGDGERVCPTDNFFVGAGWGADRGRRAHMGIDLGGKRGTPIFAVEDGVIDRTKKQSNGALQIVMRGKSGSKFYYGHMDSVVVEGGQRVKAGEVIGLMGDSGSPGAVHLHFEYWRSGGESAAVDPEPLVRRICRIAKDGTGQAGRPAPETPVADAPAAPAAEPEDKPTAKPADPIVEGDVFTN